MDRTSQHESLFARSMRLSSPTVKAEFSKQTIWRQFKSSVWSAEWTLFITLVRLFVCLSCYVGNNGSYPLPVRRPNVNSHNQIVPIRSLSFKLLVDACLCTVHEQCHRSSSCCWSNELLTGSSIGIAGWPLVHGTLVSIPRRHESDQATLSWLSVAIRMAESFVKLQQATN